VQIWPGWAKADPHAQRVAVAVEPSWLKQKGFCWKFSLVVLQKFEVVLYIMAPR